MRARQRSHPPLGSHMEIHVICIIGLLSSRWFLSLVFWNRYSQAKIADSTLKITQKVRGVEYDSALDRPENATRGDFGPIVQGYLAHKKQPPPQDHHMALGIVLL